MKTIHRKVVVHDELKEATQINFLLLQMGGLLAIGHGWGSQVMQNLLSTNIHICHTFISSMYIASIAMGNCDAATICEGVGIICVHIRYIILFQQRNKLAELLRTCRELWAQLTFSEKLIVR